MLKQFQPVVGEELEHGDLAHVAPIRAVGSEAKHGVVIAHDLGANRLGSSHIDSIDHGKSLLGYLPITNYQHSSNPYLDGNDRSIFVSHSS